MVLLERDIFILNRVSNYRKRHVRFLAIDQKFHNFELLKDTMFIFCFQIIKLFSFFPKQLDILHDTENLQLAVLLKRNKNIYKHNTIMSSINLIYASKKFSCAVVE